MTLQRAENEIFIDLKCLKYGIDYFHQLPTLVQSSDCHPSLLNCKFHHTAAMDVVPKVVCTASYSTSHIPRVDTKMLS